MQTFALYMKAFSPDPFTPRPDYKVADGVVEDNGMVRLTFASPALRSPQVYRSLDELKLVHCGEGSKVYLQPEP